MRLSCLQENLAQGIALTGHLALKATNLPVLSHVLIRAENNTLILTATNLEAGIQHTVRGRVEEEGECLIPARLLLDFLPLLPGGPLDLVSNGQGLTISTPSATTTLRVTPTTDFPIVPTMEQAGRVLTILVPSEALGRAIASIVFATGRGAQRPQFSGVLLAVSGRTLNLVATDGYRLAEAQIELRQTQQHQPPSIIAPLTAIQEAQRVLELPDQDDHATITATDNQVHIACGATQITSRLIDGVYPDYLPLFPDHPTTECRIVRPEIIRAVKAASIFSKSGLSDVTLSVSAKGQGIEVYAENAEVGAHRVKLASEGSGHAVVITLNARYLLEGLNAIEEPIVTMQFTAGDRPLLLTPTKPSSPVAYRYLLMPIRQ